MKQKLKAVKEFFSFLIDMMTLPFRYAFDIGGERSNDGWCFVGMMAFCIFIIEVLDVIVLVLLYKLYFGS